MPAQKRFKTKKQGVYYIMGKTNAGKPERIYYIMFRKDINGRVKQVHEKAGRQLKDAMTPAKAANIRELKIAGKLLTNQEKRAEQQAARLAELGKWTIDRLWSEYKSYRPLSKSLKTDENRYRNYLQANFGKLEPVELVQIEVGRLKVSLLKKRKPQTVKHILGLLKRIINFGAKNGLCPGPSFEIELPKVNNQKTEDLTPEQLQSLLNAIESETNLQAANLMKMALFTGMRRGELFKLQWADIDFDKGFIHIRGPEGGKDQTIPLNESARAVLLGHVRTGSAYVFPGRYGNQRVDIKKQVNRIKERAGLPKNFRALHGLRHVYASMLASSGQVDMYTLQKLMTHKSPIMTQRYAHLRDDAMRRASDLAGDLISGALNGKSSNVVELKKK